MAKINITVDTDEATITATINGKQVADVGYIYIRKTIDMYSKKQEPEVEVNITSMSEDSSGVKTMTSICAEKSLMGRNALAVGTVKSTFDDFLINPIVKEFDRDYSEASNSVKTAFSKIFGNRRNKNGE